MKKQKPNLWRWTEPQAPWNERKEKIIEQIRSSPLRQMSVNRKYCVQLKDNHLEARDLRRLIKEGVLVLVRQHWATSASSYLKIKE